MGKLIPVFLILLGIGAGGGAGLFLRPAPPEPDEAESLAAPAPAPADALALFEFPNQFMVPLVIDGRVGATIVLKLAVEFDEAQSDLVHANTPRLRDALLQVMFDHANAGGFNETFTDNRTLALLRRSLLEAVQKVLGSEGVRGVLITDLLRVGA